MMIHKNNLTNNSKFCQFCKDVFILPVQIFIRGHNGHNSAETRCRDFLVLNSRCHGSLILESRCRGFLSSEEMPWNHDAVAYLSPFLDVMVF